MKDATIEVVGDITKHGNADSLEICKILGFKAITKLGDFKSGDKVIYVRPDSVFPQVEWAEPYRKYSDKRVKAARLRGEWSEGVIIPITVMPEQLQATINNMSIGEDIGEYIGVYHYEPPIPQDLSAKGNLPYGIPKTDEERYQNLEGKLPFGEICDIDLKYDGKSTSFYYQLEDKMFGVLGRTLEMKEDALNDYTLMAIKYDIKNKLSEFCEKHGVSLVIRGEAYGVGIQNFENNPHSQKDKSWAMYSVYLVNERRKAEKGHRFYYRNVATEMNLPMVDLIEENVILTPEIVEKYSETLTTLKGKPFEGVVVKHANGSFKIINKTYDSKK